MKWIVLDFGTHETKALHCQMEAHRLEILDFASWQSKADFFKGLGMPEAPAWAQATIQLNELEWLNAEEDAIVVAALPSAYLETRYLKFPFKNEKKIEKVMNFELESVLPFDVEEILTRHRLLEGEGVDSTRREATVLAFGYRRDQIKSLETELRKFQTALPPITAEILSLSSLRQAIQNESVYALLEVGHSKTQFLILQRSGGILATRTLWWGGQSIIQQIASDHSLDFAEAEAAFWQYNPQSDEKGIQGCIQRAIAPFGLDLRQTLKSLPNQGILLPETLPTYLVGPMNQVGGFKEEVRAASGNDPKLDVRSFPISSLFGKAVGGLDTLKDPEKALVAVSIALSQSRHHRSRIPVFSESGFQFQQNLKRLRSSSFSILRRVALILVIPFIYSLVQFSVQSKESQMIVKNLKSILERTGLPLGEIDSTDEIVERLKKERALNRKKIDQLAEDQTSPLLVLNSISKLMPPQIKIDVKEFKVTEALVLITAETPSVEDANAVLNSLKSYSDKIKMGAVNNCASKQNCKTFTIEIEREVGT